MNVYVPYENCFLQFTEYTYSQKGAQPSSSPFIAASETLLTILLAAIFVGQADNISRQIIGAAFLVFAGAAVIALS